MGRAEGSHLNVADLRAASDRTPPQDLAAEQCVLGGMLLSKDAIADVVEVLRSEDFYKPAHQTVFDAIVDLYGRGEPADAVTVSDLLAKRGELLRIGGAPYLHTLVASVPTAANAGYYGKIVSEQAILRRLVQAGTRIVQMGYSAEGEVDGLVDRAQAEVYDVTARRISDDYQPLSALMDATLAELETIGNRSGEMVGVPTGFADLDELTNGLHPGNMVIVAGRPAMGKSTVALDIARSASIKHGLTSAIFSLEMARNEIVMRLLSAEAQVPLHHMRSGSMSEQEWARLAHKMGAASEAPLFIDDSPNMTMMEIRAKCRRLKQRHDLRLVVIDYMQLMTSGRKVESRQQEVSEFSRSLKLLAKELEVPVIAISQLNRGPEQRTDKKPMLADLRESGCLTADTRVLRADTGTEVTLGELHDSGERDIRVWALDDSLRYVQSTMTHVFPTGTRPVYRMKLASGRTLRATANHRFLTISGWERLEDLQVGSRIGCPRHVCAPVEAKPASEDEIVVLAHILGDGSAISRQPASHEKFVPSWVFQLPNDQVALFLNHLWSTDGTIVLNKNGRGGAIRYNTSSRQLADGVAALLLRFGITARIRCIPQIKAAKKYRDQYAVDISGADGQKVFLRRIGVHGERGKKAAALLARIADSRSNTNVDTVPREVWGRVREILGEKEVPHREFQAAIGTTYCGSALFKNAPSRERLGRVAAALDSAELELLATNDVFWDEIVSVEPDGTEDVFDATVLDRHNFIANGIAAHNSLEQDADVVILLHRDDAYERDHPRAGEADFIVAKHRNGPTGTVVVAFQGHYSRFVDMAAI